MTTGGNAKTFFSTWLSKFSRKKADEQAAELKKKHDDEVRHKTQIEQNCPFNDEKQ